MECVGDGWVMGQKLPITPLYAENQNTKAKGDG